MASLIKGIKVILHERIEDGVDAFNAPAFKTRLVEVDNVLVSPTNDSEILTENQIGGSRQEYELCIPKGDSHNWENSTVEFFGKLWQTFGPVQEWIEDLMPLDWNRKVKVARYE